jgi:hypothetical protein
MEMINEKLNTGYHGVKHLFKGQNPHKPGTLNRFVSQIYFFNKKTLFMKYNFQRRLQTCINFLMWLYTF